ncbi:hypothetical protein A1D22_09160 [Pasteurellaceae bacterium LFhippo2]|nr:hypothetical protein [Pasteurellaceae bacterium LFhippo2]
MKIVKTFRMEKEFSDKLNLLAKSQGITFSQLIELACFLYVGKKALPTKVVEKHKKLETIDLKFCVDHPTYKKLINAIQAKNSTLSQEINYRLSASLDNPVFDPQEYRKLSSLHFDLNRLGNLFKLAINNQMPIDIAVLNEIESKIKAVSDELKQALSHSRKRTL